MIDAVTFSVNPVLVVYLAGVLVGFARENDGAHSPNEKYDVASYHKGIRTWARIISQFA